LPTERIAVPGSVLAVAGRIDEPHLDHLPHPPDGAFVEHPGSETTDIGGQPGILPDTVWSTKTVPDLGFYQVGDWRRRRESNPGTGLCRPLPKPLGHAAATGHHSLDVYAGSPPHVGRREPSAPTHEVRPKLDPEPAAQP
jgi:hypothetical protein